MGHFQQNNTIGLKSMELKYYIIESHGMRQIAQGFFFFLATAGLIYQYWKESCLVTKKIFLTFKL